MATISQLIARRADLGTFVVHLSRKYKKSSARDNLARILTRQVIRARHPFGSAVQALCEAIREGQATQQDLDSQNCVCFTETPLEHLHLLLTEVEDADRICTFEPYGVALTKKVARRLGVNPIWYIDITPGHDWLTNPLNCLIEAAIEGGDFAESAIAQLTPFIEQMGSRAGQYRKEFWWEREWRHHGDFELPPRIIVLAPEEDHASFAKITKKTAVNASFVDPSWGLEAIIARLAGFEADDVGLF
jgi:hypothetical protein